MEDEAIHFVADAVFPSCLRGRGQRGLLPDGRGTVKLSLMTAWGTVFFGQLLVSLLW